MTRLTHVKVRQDVIETARAMNASGLNQGTSGNVSARVSGRGGPRFAITPSGMAYETLEPKHIPLTKLDGTFGGNWKPSSEWRMHADIYRAFPEAKAVIHTHSSHATALSCHRLSIPAFHYMIAVAGGDTIRCADYATFGTQELSDNMVTALEGRSACLLANHGMICFSTSLSKALWLAGEVEELARQYILARQLGEPVILGDNEMGRIQRLFETYGQQAKSES